MTTSFHTNEIFTVPELDNTNSGIGLRAPHHQDVIAQKPDVGFLEVHSENFFHLDSPHFKELEILRQDYPISLHGVGLSLGSADGLDAEHVAKLKALADRIDPAVVSEHVSWSRIGGVSVPDLLPVPMTKEALSIMSQNIDQVQNALGRPILVENPSAYLSFKSETISEPAFLEQLCQRTGCGLLLDINNIYVSAHNTGFDPIEYLDNIPAERVVEIHLAGYQINAVDDQGEIFVDAHNQAVHRPVWELYDTAMEILGDKATLIEWDNDLPDLETLVAEAKKADKIRAENQGKSYVA